MSGLLLSYLPFGEADSGQIADLDPPRMVGMAYGQMRELGHSVFFARLVDSLENGEDPATLKSAIEEARLHMCVLTRCTWYVCIQEVELTSGPTSAEHPATILPSCSVRCTLASSSFCSQKV